MSQWCNNHYNGDTFLFLLLFLPHILTSSPSTHIYLFSFFFCFPYFPLLLSSSLLCHRVSSLVFLAVFFASPQIFDANKQDSCLCNACLSSTSDV